MGFSQRFIRLAALGGLAFAASPSSSQILDNDRVGVQSIQTPAPALGNVVSAPAGTTVFTVSPSSGNVSRSSGNGYRVSGGTTRSLVSVFCGGPGYCDSTEATITVGSIGSPTARAGQLTNFTVSPVTAVITAAPTGTNPITFKIGPIGRNQTKSFYVGADFPILGDNSGQPTGAASSGFEVGVSLTPLPFSGSGTGLATATVFRPIVVSSTSNMSFGIVSRPLTGNGTVNLDAVTGVRTVTGNGAEGINSPAPFRAAYTVSGEGGQVFSAALPSTFTMTGPGGEIVVTPTISAPGTQTLSSSLGSAGSYSFHVGGSFPMTSTTPLGSYSGTFAVIVQYN